MSNSLKIPVHVKRTCGRCPVRYKAVCSKCDRAEFQRLEKIKMYRTYRSGDVIFSCGEELRFVASVVEGVAKLSRTLEDGRTQMVGLLLPSDFIGHPGRTRIDFDVVAANDVVLCCFDRAGFQSLLEEVPHVSQRMIEMAMDELDAARDWMLLLGRKTAGEKIATFIEMVVRRQYGDPSELATGALELPLSRGEIANYLGTTLETVSRHISAMKNHGILEFIDQRRFRVRDLERLQAATGDDNDGGMIN